MAAIKKNYNTPLSLTFCNYLSLSPPLSFFKSYLPSDLLFKSFCLFSLSFSFSVVLCLPLYLCVSLAKSLKYENLPQSKLTLVIFDIKKMTKNLPHSFNPLKQKIIDTFTIAVLKLTIKMFLLISVNTSQS